MPTQYGHFKIYGYVNDITGEHHVALVKVISGTAKMPLPRAFRVPHRRCVRFHAL